MTGDTLVVVAAERHGRGVVAARFADAGVQVSHEQALSRRHPDDGTLLGAGPFGSGDAARLVRRLRNEGWPATDRPLGGGHLAVWRRHTRPVVVADRLAVCFPWSEYDTSSWPAVVEIDPGRSFGTGAHPSTRLLLEVLARRLAPGDRVLDVGCGSGVLAVAAAVLDAGSVTAVDVEAHAAEATADNARRNRVAAAVRAGGDAVESVTGAYDAVVANIGATTLVALARPIAARVRPGGWLGLSGISPAQTSVVAAAYRRCGCPPIETVHDGEWAALVVGGPPA